MTITSVHSAAPSTYVSRPPGICGNALISWGFPILAASSRAAPFVFFACMMVVQLVIVAVVYPETRGFTLEEMEKRLAIRTR